MFRIKIPNQDFITSLFERKDSLKVEFVCSGLKNSDLPESEAPEFAFVGRSNVGKSSLINYLAGQKKLARVSNTPGRTQTINLFSVENGNFYFVDLPGYGYAESSHATQAHWATGMQRFFEERKGLSTIFFLIDIRREVQPEDESLSLWFQSLGLKVIAIQTKCDKVHKSKWNEIRNNHAKKLALHPSQIISSSSEKKIGLSDLLKIISGILDSLEVENEEIENAPKNSRR